MRPLVGSALKGIAAIVGLAATVAFTPGCGTGSDSGDFSDQPGTGAGASSGGQANAGGSAGSLGGSGTGDGSPSAIGDSFQLRSEFAGPCSKANVIDVNLGNAADAFVRAAYCQINGSEPPDDVKSMWVTQLTTVSYVRRIDVVKTLCAAAKRSCVLSFSDPWVTQPELDQACTRKGTRDLGAVLMFFSDCPNGVNCNIDWANTHAEGMFAVSPLLGFGSSTTGVYNPKNPGFWRRELIDAKYAGLSFFLLNTYGPDITGAGDPLAQLSKALDDTGGAVKIGMFDDTSTWGHAGGAFQPVPDLNNPAAAAQAIYDAKWKPFFSKVPQKYWYLFKGRPVIYFYNAGTLKPQNKAAATVAALRSHFQADFNVSPFLIVDAAFFDDPDMPNVADARFQWDTFQNPQMISHSNLNGVNFSHFMVKWDALGRDDRTKIATASDRIYKDETLLKQRLIDSASDDLAVIATWNDMGEGTGIDRNYDYYVGGNWLEPDAFMKDIRASQCSP